MTTFLRNYSVNLTQFTYPDRRRTSRLQRRIDDMEIWILCSLIEVQDLIHHVDDKLNQRDRLRGIFSQ